MRMKKYLILAVTAAIVAVGCTKTFEATPTPQPAIGFGTWLEHLTKAEARVQGTSTFLAGDTFAVYGSKTRASGDPTVVTVFDDDVVEKGASAWDYTNHRFWDSDYEHYIFYGVSPSAIGTAATVNAQTGAITTAGITFAGDDNDILIAEKKTVDKGSDPYFNNYGTVNMVFNHAASLVDIKVKKAPSLASATVTVSALALENIQNAGVLTIGSDEYTKTTATSSTAANIIVGSWSSTGTGSYGPTSGVTKVYGDTDGTAAISSSNKKVISTDTAFNAETPATPAASTDLITSLVVKPQTFTAPTDRDNPTDASNASAQKLTITYQISVTDAASNTSTNEYSSTLWLYDFDGVDNDAQAATYVGSWAPAKHYIFYVTIDAHEIKFSASINDWDATVINGYHYLVN